MTGKPVKLTTRQREALELARDEADKNTGYGALPGKHGMRGRMGGAYRRMLERLAERGLLTAKWPYAITMDGRAALTKATKP